MSCLAAVSAAAFNVQKLLVTPPSFFLQITSIGRLIFRIHKVFEVNTGPFFSLFHCADWTKLRINEPMCVCTAAKSHPHKSQSTLSYQTYVDFQQKKAFFLPIVKVKRH